MLIIIWPKFEGEIYQDWVEGERLHCDTIVRSLCGNTVLMMCL